MESTDLCTLFGLGPTDLCMLLSSVVQNSWLIVIEMCTSLSSAVQGSGSTAGNLFIVGVQYKHEGVFTCQVTTGMDHQSASAILSVRG